jgi:hypothetical protein
MSKPHDLAAIFDHVSEDDLASLPRDDIRAPLEGIPRRSADPMVAVARRKLATAIFSSTARDDDSASRGRCIH